MSDCTDRDMGRRLEAYELGMLSAEERKEFERHLIECEYCSKKAAELGEAVHLLRHDPDVREQISRMDEKATGEKKEVRETRRPRWVSAVTAVAVIAVAVVVLVLHPWRIEIHTDEPAVAAVDRLAVTYFDNVADTADSDRLGEIAANLLITDLSESRHLSVVSGQRLYDILKMLGHEGQKRIDRRTATEVAEKAQADWLLVGSILQVKPTMVATSQLIDVGTGQVSSSQKVIGNAGDDIFAVVDTLSRAIRQDLSIPMGEYDEVDRPVAEVTTHSPEAYKYYLNGLELVEKYYKADALKMFEKALEYDSTLAMAYYYLAELKNRDYIEDAMKYVDRAGRREQYFIRSRYALFQEGDYTAATKELQDAIKQYPDEKRAYYWLGVYAYSQRDFHKAIKEFNEAIAIDPLYKSALNHLAYAYDYTEEYDKAIASIDKYISLVPDEANPYDSRGDIYASMNLLDQAVASYRQAIEIKPDFYDSWSKMTNIYLFKRDFAEARECNEHLSGSLDQKWQSTARLYSALIKLGQCQMTAALDELRRGIVADSLGSDGGWGGLIAAKHFAMSVIYETMGELDRAIAEMEETIRLNDIIYPTDKESYRCVYTALLASASYMDRAEDVVSDLSKFADSGTIAGQTYCFAKGAVDYYQSNLDSAIVNLQENKSVLSNFPVEYLLGQVYVSAGKYENAIEGLNRLYSTYRVWAPSFISKYNTIPYYLGLAYEGAGSPRMAVASYSELLDIWKGADVEPALVKDAKTRLAKLSATP
jgi:tetratricopeptide (TPR) repeat protein/TolB-like protein